MALSRTTQDHDEIRKWAEARGAKPAAVASTEKSGSTGILRLEFPGKPHANDSALQEISWEEFFEKFDASGLEFIYQEKTAEGEVSNFNKMVYPENDKAHDKSHAKSGSHSSSGKSGNSSDGHAKSSSSSASHSGSHGTSHSNSASASKNHGESHTKSGSSSSKSSGSSSHSKSASGEKSRKSGSSHTRAA